MDRMPLFDHRIAEDNKMMNRHIEVVVDDDNNNNNNTKNVHYQLRIVDKMPNSMKLISLVF
jgi:hypothetical protein